MNWYEFIHGSNINGSKRRTVECQAGREEAEEA